MNALSRFEEATQILNHFAIFLKAELSQKENEAFGKQIFNEINELKNEIRALKSEQEVPHLQPIIDKAAAIGKAYLHDSGKVTAALEKAKNEIVVKNVIQEKAFIHRLERPIALFNRYEELTSRLSEEEKKILNEKLANLEDKEKEIEKLLKGLTEANYTDEIFKSENLPYYAIEAYKKGFIDEYQFGTLQLFWSIGKYHQNFNDLKVISLFKEGKINEEAKQLIVETLYTFVEGRGITFLTDQELESFFEEMKKTPLSEQNFFLVQDIQEGLTVSKRIQTGTGINIFGRTYRDRMIPSFSMMQKILKVKNGDKAVKLNPVLGLSAYKHMKRATIRDIAVPFPHVTLPEKADSFKAPWYDFTFHDFYHAILVSGIPVEHRKRFIRLSELANQERKLLKEKLFSPIDETLKTLIMVGVDMETTSYRSELSFKYSPEEKFWDEIAHMFQKAYLDPEASQFDVDTALKIFSKLAAEIISDELVRQGLFKRANKPSNPMLLFAPSIERFPFLKLIWLTSQNKDISFKEAYLKTKIELDKKLACIQRQLDNQEFVDQLFSKEDLEKFPQENRLMFAFYVLNGTPLNMLLALPENDRKFCINYFEYIAQLQCCGISFEQVLQNKELVIYSELIITALKSGTTWKDLIQSQFLSEAIKNKTVILLLFNMGATYQEMVSLKPEVWNLFKRSEWDLEKLEKFSFSFKDLIKLDLTLLEKVLNTPHALAAVLNLVKMDDFLKLERKVQMMLLEKNYEISGFLQRKVSLKELLALEGQQLERVMKNYQRIFELLEHKISSKEILSLTPEQFERVTSFGALFLLKLGFTLQQIAKEKRLRNINIQDLRSCGLTPDQILQMDDWLFYALTHYCVIGCLKEYPLQWIIHSLSQESDPENLVSFAYLKALERKGFSKDKIQSLPYPELKALLKKEREEELERCRKLQETFSFKGD